MAQPTKRRRIDATATLSKPFKSPLRRPTATTDIQPSTPVSKTDIPSTPTTSAEPSSFPTSSPPVTPALNRRKPSTPNPLQSPDPEIIALQKQRRSIQSRLVALRSELDNATQALRLENSSKDSELESLIIKWRLISQDAADEAFAGAQERITRMGGMAAWNLQSKRDSTRWEFDDNRHEAEHVDEDEIESGDIENLEKDGSGNGEDTEEVQLTALSENQMLTSLGVQYGVYVEDVTC